eukprot:13469396-Ditylum_brightwellii.AAC.1
MDENIAMQNNCLMPDLNKKNLTIGHDVSPDGFICEVQHRIRMLQIHSPVVALASITTILAISCTFFHSIYVNEYSARSDRTFATKVIGLRSHHNPLRMGQAFSYLQR